MQNAHHNNESIQPNYDAIKAKQQATWGSGDYGKVGVTLQLTGEELCEAVDLRAGDSVLDVAGGNGNVSLAAARRFCHVTSSDYVQELLDQSKRRAEAEGLAIDYRLADAENLPFQDAAFDHVVSTFGVMFAPDQARAASELVRVCRPGGRIGLANWTPEGFVGRLLKTVGRYVPPPAGIDSPVRWGTVPFLHQKFAGGTRRIQVDVKQFVFRYRSPEHFLTTFRHFYGPVHKAFLALDEVQQASLSEDILALIRELNTVQDGGMAVPSDYLQVVITR